jgi:hypothetical protein
VSQAFVRVLDQQIANGKATPLRLGGEPLDELGRDALIREITAFVSAEIFPRFELPQELARRGAKRRRSTDVVPAGVFLTCK